VTGPGKYDQATSVCLHWLEAKAVILIVIGGNKGSGFEVQVAGDNEAAAQKLNLALPAMLREMAEQIEMDNQEESDN